jgi:hypothetical protein
MMSTWFRRRLRRVSVAPALRLPFAHLNLRFNPFGEPSREERARLAVVDLPELRPGDPVQLIGDSGRGKTTHLLALRARHEGALYRKLHDGEDLGRAPEWPRAGSIFLLDEAQRLAPRALRGLLRLPLTLALGTHHDLSPAADRALRTVRVDAIDVARLRAIVARRIEWARRAPGPVPVVDDGVLAALIARHGSDIRAVEGTLYEAVQRMEEPGHVEV